MSSRSIQSIWSYLKSLNIQMHLDFFFMFVHLGCKKRFNIFSHFYTVIGHTVCLYYYTKVGTNHYWCVKSCPVCDLKYSELVKVEECHILANILFCGILWYVLLGVLFRTLLLSRSASCVFEKLSWPRTIISPQYRWYARSVVCILP